MESFSSAKPYCTADMFFPFHDEIELRAEEKLLYKSWSRTIGVQIHKIGKLKKEVFALVYVLNKNIISLIASYCG